MGKGNNRKTTESIPTKKSLMETYHVALVSKIMELIVARKLWKKDTT